MPHRGCLAALVAVACLAVAGPALGAAVPSLRVEGPSQAGQGEPFTVSVFLENVGDTDGSVYVIDIDAPPAAQLRSAGFANTVSRGTSVTFDSSGRAIHPILTDGGQPEILEGKPGNELWVSFDQLNQTAFVGVANRLDAEFVLAKDARPGRPVRIRFRGGFLRSSPGGGSVVTRWRSLRVTPTAITLEEVAGSLASDPVFAAASADPGLSDADERIVETAVADAGTPVYVAVLPASAGSPEGVLERLARLSGLGGTFAVVVGDRYRASSDTIPEAELDRLLAEAGAGEADAEPRDVLSAFVHGVDAYVEAPDGSGTTAATAATTAGAGGPDAAVSTGDGGGSALPWILSAAIAGGVALLVTGRLSARALARRRRERRRLAELREAGEDGLTSLGEAIAELDLDVEMPDVPQKAKDDYALALSAYEEASRQLPRAADAEALASVVETIALGREAMASAKERLAAGSQAPGSDVGQEG